MKKWFAKRCVRCGKPRICLLRFATVEPVTGRGYWDEDVDGDTGKVSHAWPELGKWVFVCGSCERVCVGLEKHRPLDMGASWRRKFRVHRDVH